MVQWLIICCKQACIKLPTFRLQSQISRAIGVAVAVIGVTSIESNQHSSRLVIPSKQRQTSVLVVQLSVIAELDRPVLKEPLVADGGAWVGDSQTVECSAGVSRDVSMDRVELDPSWSLVAKAESVIISNKA